MHNSKDYYAILGVMPTASQEDIKRAYRVLALKHHPGLYPGSADTSSEKMRDVDEAFEVLSDPDLRRDYDRSYTPSIAQKPTHSRISHAPRYPARPVQKSIGWHINNLVKKAVWFVVSGIASSVLCYLVTWGLTLGNPSTGTATRTPRPINTVTKELTPSPRHHQLTLTPAAGQRCMAHSKADQPLQLLSERSTNADILGTIASDTYFSGKWYGEWFEIDDSLPDLPAHGFVRREDIVLVACF